MKQILLFIALSISLLSFSQQGTLNIETTPEIKEVISKKIEYNKQNHLIDGYRIQLFYGSEVGVNNANSKFKSLFPYTTSYIVFESPDWKIQVGNYKTRLEATKAKAKFKLEFEAAFILSKKIVDQ